MPSLFQKGSRFSSSSDSPGRWQVVRKLGEGQFAEVYEVRDTLTRDRDARYAVKIDRRRDVKSVKQELKALTRLQELSAHSVCQSVDMGTFDDRSFIVMELLGPNLAEARLKIGGWIAPSVVRCVGLSTLAALQGMHEAGLLHRDVKPANFALFPPDSNMMQGVWKIIDFGLARRFTSDDGVVLPQRVDAAFRGSTTYASINAHNEQDLGRRDDLWSWLYCLVELLGGTLPWRSDASADGRDGEAVASSSGREVRERVRIMKEQCIAQPSMLTRNMHLPDAFLHISNHLQSLGFADAPDYTFIRSCLLQLGELPPPAAVPATQLSYSAWDHQPQGQEQYSMQAAQQGQYGVQAMQAGGQYGGQAQQQGGLCGAQGMDLDERVGPPHHQGVSWPIQPPLPDPYHPSIPRSTPLSPVRDTPLSPGPEGCAGDGGRGQEQQRADVWHQSQVTSHQAMEERGVKMFSEAAAAVQMGLLSPEAHQLQLRLKALPPVEALSVIASVIQESAQATDAAVGNILAQALGDLAAFTRVKAQQATDKHLQHCSVQPYPTGPGITPFSQDQQLARPTS